MTLKHLYQLFILTIAVVSFNSCGTYKKSIIIRTEKSIIDSAANRIQLQDGHYPILVNDKIELKVYSNKGELLIDPNVQFRQEFIGAENRQTTVQNANYLVEKDSLVYLPMIGPTKVVGYTKNQLDSLLRIKYSEFYEDPFVLSKVVSRRVYIFGAVEGKEIFLEDENMNVLEVLALSEYDGLLARTDNIKIVRDASGDNPQIIKIDLSTPEGMKKSSLTVFPNDVIYLQPRRKTFSEGMRDAAIFVSILTSTVTLLFLISQ